MGFESASASRSTQKKKKRSNSSSQSNTSINSSFQEKTAFRSAAARRATLRRTTSLNTSSKYSHSISEVQSPTVDPEIEIQMVSTLKVMNTHLEKLDSEVNSQALSIQDLQTQFNLLDATIEAELNILESSIET